MAGTWRLSLRWPLTSQVLCHEGDVLLRATWLRGAAAAGTAIALCIGGFAPDAAADTVSGTVIAKATRTTAQSRTTLDGVDAAAAAACAPGPNEYNRTEMCSVNRATVTVLRNRTPVGEVTFTITQSIHLHVIGRNFSENLAISNVRSAGEGGGVRVTLSVACGNPCSARTSFPQGAVLGSLKGTIAYHDATTAVHSTASRYGFGFTKPGFTPGAFSYSSLSYRCDDAFRGPKGGGQGAGCVFPRFTPTMTQMAGLPDIAANIRRIQTNGPGHYGRYGSGHPLHRLADPKKQNANRRAVCSRRVVGPPPRPGVSCDEYPFASTREGGTTLSARNRGTAWVPSGEQDSQAGLITGFYKSQRVLDKDAFWVAV